MQEMHQPPRRFVGDADVADLAGTHQIVQRLQGLADGHGLVVTVVLEAEAAEEVGFAVGPVQFIEGNVIGLQAFQAGVERKAEMIGIEAWVAVADPRQISGAARRLSREDHLVAAVALLEPGTDVFLRAAVGGTGYSSAASMKLMPASKA